MCRSIALAQDNSPQQVTTPLYALERVELERVVTRQQMEIELGMSVGQRILLVWLILATAGVVVLGVREVTREVTAEAPVSTASAAGPIVTYKGYEGGEINVLKRQVRYSLNGVEFTLQYPGGLTSQCFREAVVGQRLPASCKAR